MLVLAQACKLRDSYHSFMNNVWEPKHCVWCADELTLVQCAFMRTFGSLLTAIMVLEYAPHKVHTFSLVLSLPEVGGTRIENQKDFLYGPV